MLDEKEVKIIGKVEICILSDGSVSVSGPLKNTAMIISVFGKALEVVANFVGKEESAIVAQTPGQKV